MKLKQKASEKQPLMLILLVTVIFASIGVAIIYGFIKFIMNFDLDTFVTEFSSGGFGVLIAFGLGCFGFYFVYLLFKPPLKCLGTLTSKKEQMYKGKKIWNMRFSIKDNKGYASIGCYTEEENPLSQGKKYIICYKEYLNKIVNVLEYDENEKLSTIKAPSLTPVFYYFFFVFGLSIAFLIFKVFYDIVNGHSIFGNFIVLVFFSVTLYGIYRFYKMSITDNEGTIEEKKAQELKLEEDKKIQNILSKYSRLKESNKKVSSVFERKIFYVIFKYFIAWIIFVFFCNITISINTGQNFIRLLVNNFNFYFIFAIFCFIFACLNSLFLLSYLNLDKKLIKKYEIIVEKEEVPIKDLKQIRIFRVSANKELQKYYIVDDNNILLYKVDSDGLFNNKYLISDHLNNKVGEIIVKPFYFNTYVIRMVNENPFCIRRKADIAFDYIVFGRDYEIHGENAGILNMICDNNGETLAAVSANEAKKGKYVLGDSTLVVHPDVVNSSELIFISLCIVVSNYNSYK